MRKWIVFFIISLCVTDSLAGYGRGGSSGGFRSGGSSFRSSYSSSYSRPSYNRSYSSPSRSYSSNTHTTVVNHGSQGMGGIGPHLGAGALGYMLGSAGNRAAPVVINGQPAQASYVPPVEQPVIESYPQNITMPSQQMGLFGIIFWTLFCCFAISVVFYLVRQRNEHCDH